MVIDFIGDWTGEIIVKDDALTMGKSGRRVCLWSTEVILLSFSHVESEV